MKYILRPLLAFIWWVILGGWMIPLLLIQNSIVQLLYFCWNLKLRKEYWKGYAYEVSYCTPDGVETDLKAFNFVDLFCFWNNSPIVLDKNKYDY